MRQFTEEQAVIFYKSGQWKDLDDEELVRLQLFEKRICIPFAIFHRACNKVFDRLVLSCEFANAEKLRQEYLGQRSDPTIEEIFKPIKDKVIFWMADD